jgi:hypothetical protein
MRQLSRRKAVANSWFSRKGAKEYALMTDECHCKTLKSKKDDLQI